MYSQQFISVNINSFQAPSFSLQQLFIPNQSNSLQFILDKQMNLLKNQKYRAKIMQHLLCEYGNQQKKENIQVNGFVQNTNCKQNKAENSSIIFKNVYKQKALITDSQDTERKVMRNFEKNNTIDLINPHKENKYSHHQNIPEYKMKRKICLDEQPNKTKGMQHRSHLNKQAYHYHQKIPTSYADNYLQQQKEQKMQTKYNKTSKQQNKQNKQNDKINANRIECKQKRHRFITVDKVISALTTKSQIRIQDTLESQMKRIIPQIPNSEQELPKDNPEKHIQMGGYLNSPNQLITYRQDNQRHQYENSTSNEQKLHQGQQNSQCQVSHFLLCTSPEKLRRGKETLNQAGMNNLEQKLVKKDSFVDEVGAVKILSKSRQKSTKQYNLKQDFDQKSKKQRKSEQNQNFLQQQQGQIKTTIQIIQDTVAYQSKNLTINPISEKIVNRIGKQSIISSLKQRQMTKRGHIIQQKQAKQIKMMKQCSFRPKINSMSISIDQSKNRKIKIGHLIDVQESKQKCGISMQDPILYNKNSRIGQTRLFQGNSEDYYTYENQSNKRLKSHQNKWCGQVFQKLENASQKSKENSRHEELYNNHRTLQAKKQFLRQKSIQQIRFKPQINLISKKIMETKRNSLNNSASQYFQQTSASTSQPSSTCKKTRCKSKSTNNTHLKGQEQLYLSSLPNKRKSLNFPRNLQGLQIGQYLYKQAMRMKKKKQAVTHGAVQNFKPLGRSEQIINEVKQKRLSECFFQLLDVEAGQSVQPENMSLVTMNLALQPKRMTLQPASINLCEGRFQRQPLKYLIPLLQETRQLDVSLTKEQFIQSGLKLIDYLSRDQKAQFLSRRFYHKYQTNNKQSPQTQTNKSSQLIIHKKQIYSQDIYQRGLVYKKQVKDKIYLEMEDKVRKQLQKCPFKPRINAEFQLIQ